MDMAVSEVEGLLEASRRVARRAVQFSIWNSNKEHGTRSLGLEVINETIWTGDLFAMRMETSHLLLVQDKLWIAIEYNDIARLDGSRIED